MTIGQNSFGNSPLCSAAWLDIAGATHYTRWLCCHQLYLTPLKWKKERSFPFPASSTHFPSSIVPKKVVVVVESIDFTWSYLSLSSFLSALTNQSTHLTLSPPRAADAAAPTPRCIKKSFSPLLLFHPIVENKGIIWPHFAILCLL